jgi:hypothetical protein
MAKKTKKYSGNYQYQDHLLGVQLHWDQFVKSVNKKIEEKNGKKS